MQKTEPKMWPMMVTDEVHRQLEDLKTHPTEPFYVVIARLIKDQAARGNHGSRL